jgi:hypothetical protein
MNDQEKIDAAWLGGWSTTRKLTCSDQHAQLFVEALCSPRPHLPEQIEISLKIGVRNRDGEGKPGKVSGVWLEISWQEVYANIAGAASRQTYSNQFGVHVEENALYLQRTDSSRTIYMFPTQSAEGVTQGIHKVGQWLIQCYKACVNDAEATVPERDQAVTPTRGQITRLPDPPPIGRTPAGGSSICGNCGAPAVAPGFPR